MDAIRAMRLRWQHSGALWWSRVAAWTEAAHSQGFGTPASHGVLSWHPARRRSDRARLAERLIQYHSTIAAVQLALDAEQGEGGPRAYKPQTEKCLRLVYGLLQEALGVMPEEAGR